MENEVKELTELVKSVQGQVEGYQKELASLKEKGIDKDGLKEFTDKLEAAESAQNLLKEELAELATKMNSDREKSEKGLSLSDEAFQALTKQSEDLKRIYGAKSGMVSFESKAAGTMLVSGNYSGGTFGLTAFEPGLTRLVRRQPFMRQLMRVRTTNLPYAAWAEQRNADGGAGMTAEGAAKTQADFDIVERQESHKKVTSYIKTSREALNDIGYLRDEINTELMELVELKLDAQLYSGDGTGDNLDGILTGAQAFSVAGTDLANGVIAANNYDVLRAAAWQIQNGLFQANYAVINPVDAAKMDLEKTTEGMYVIPPFTSESGRRVAGMVVVENTGVTAGDFLVGDFSKATLSMREMFNISVGYVNDDFTKNLITILGELRALAYVKTNHANAFVTGTFSDGITALGSV